MIISIDIGQPSKKLSPNGRPGNHFEKGRLVKQARNIAYLLTLNAFAGGRRPHLSDLGDPVPVKVFCYYKNEAHRPDADNVVAMCKSYFDGMAQALVIDDRHFIAPPVEFIKDTKRRRGLVIQLGSET